ncbi:MAG: HEAT repeat domain-containing protein [Bryobacteraceae bacterium]
MMLHAGWLLCVAAGIAAAQPRLVNAKVETQALQGSLDETFKHMVAAQADPAWIGYAVPVVPGDRSMCCYYSNSDSNYGYRGCSLEPRSPLPSANGGNAGPVLLEAPKNFYVMFRVERNEVTKLRTFSADCELDAGGTTIHWLTGVRAADSVTLLASYQPTQSNALSAIALHLDPSADAVLEKFLAPSEPESVRRRTAVQMGQLRGRKGFEVLRGMMRDEKNERVRESAVQGLAFSREPGALEMVFSAAKSDPSIRIRGEAVSWLAREAGRKASGAIQEAIESDPELSVKKKAVFALSQLPRDEGIPLLIDVAKTNKNPEVRKQAMHWLGQSHDQRALSFFEEVLSK